MTTIVFKETKSGVEIAFDSQTTSGYSHQESEHNKVFKLGQVVIGVSGLVSYANHIQNMHIPKHPDNMTSEQTDRWVYNVLVPALRQAGSKTSPDGAYMVEGGVLVAVNKRVYEIGCDYSQIRNKSGRYSIGSGSPYALAALAAGASAKRAVEIASQSDVFTGHTIKTLTC